MSCLKELQNYNFGEEIRKIVLLASQRRSPRVVTQIAPDFEVQQDVLHPSYSQTYLASDTAFALGNPQKECRGPHY